MEEKKTKVNWIGIGWFITVVLIIVLVLFYYIQKASIPELDKEEIVENCTYKCGQSPSPETWGELIIGLANCTGSCVYDNITGGKEQ